ncbi:hypothetical protein F4604DRAFT_1957637 [Suillus subluteus]|nr:hypothetical protein F4604DRAFT_1957637 [Suillus subluteus]
MYKLNCIVLGDDPRRVFEIKIAPTASVSALQKVIKDAKKQRLRHVAADCLDLWQVDLPYNETIKHSLSTLKLDTEKSLSPVTKLQKVFSKIPEDEHLHIVIQPADGSRAHLQSSPSTFLSRTRQLRSEYSRKFPQNAPSSQGKPSEFKDIQEDPDLTIHWDRPPSAAHTIPTTLLHPIFGAFMDDCENHEPTPDDNKLVMALSVTMSGFFTDDTRRASKFRELLRQHNIDLRATTIDGSNYTTNGDMQYKGFRYAIAEVKNEIGSTKAEPHMQVLSYYIHSTTSFSKEKPAFRFPCIAITLFGSHIDFSAAVWSTCPNMQVISTALPLFHHHTDTKMRVMVARHVGALRKALRSLSECYERMSSNITSPSPDPHLKFLDSEFPDPRFPYPYSYTCVETSLTCHFTYCHQMDTTRLLFSAKTTDAKMLCIKFVHHYSKEVHQRCASGGFAPVLYGFEHLPGGWYMVVMEFITDDYCCLGELFDPSPHHDALAAELQSLHEEGYVHGDIRDTNVMVKKDHSPGFKLVDFDWSGKIGEIRYPINVYRGKRLWRPAGAEDGQLILAEHDIQMLHAMFRRV